MITNGKRLGRGLPVLLFFFLFAAALPGEGAALSLEEIAGLMADSSYQEGEQQAFLTLFRELEAEQLPLEPLFRRWQQGRSRQIPFIRLLSVLEGEKQRFLEAAELLAEEGAALALSSRNPQHLSRLALLRKGGVGIAALKDLIRAASDGAAFDAASLLLLELSEWGLPPDKGARLVTALLKSRIAPRDYPYLLPVVQKGRQAGYESETLIAEMIRFLPRSGDLWELEEYLGL